LTNKEADNRNGNSHPKENVLETLHSIRPNK
jgi:hypothetical protein